MCVCFLVQQKKDVWFCWVNKWCFNVPFAFTKAESIGKDWTKRARESVCMRSISLHFVDALCLSDVCNACILSIFKSIPLMGYHLARELKSFSFQHPLQQHQCAHSFQLLYQPSLSHTHARTHKLNNLFLTASLPLFSLSSSIFVSFCLRMYI